jgi:hypothetical protein
LVYVDDIIIASSYDEAINALLSNLRTDFALKDLGLLSYFLGIEVKKCDDGIVLTQEKFMMDVLKRVSMSDCEPTRTPLVVDEKLSLVDGDLLSLEDATSYRIIIGALQYLTLTHPDISLSVNKIC